MKKVTLLILIISFSFQNSIYSQKNDRDGLMGAIVGAALVAGAIEQNKELLENIAANFVMSNYDYSKFRVQVIGQGAGGKKIFDQGTVSLIPFAFTELDNNNSPVGRKLLMLFASNGWTNEFGVDYSKLRWEFWGQKKWNDLVLKYSQINSPNKIEIKNYMLPLYKNKSNLKYTVLQKELKGYSDNVIYISPVNKDDLYQVFERDAENKYMDLRKMKLAKDGWKDKYKTVPSSFILIIRYRFWFLIKN